MVFSSMLFLFMFLPIVLFVYYGVLKKAAHKNIFLLIASLVFYGWGEPTNILIMILSIFLNFKIGLILHDTEDATTKKTYLILGVLANLAFLFMFKYEGFFVTYANKVFHLGIEGLNLGLPIGISFFTFQALSYLVDVYRGTVEVQKNLLYLGLYISFFPQLVAGPIVRYSTVAYQIENRRTTLDQFSEGIRRFIVGVGKKIILANQFAVVAEKAFATDELSVAFAWLGAITYTLQIYFDFSGYSDMAIGLGKMFGFEFLENFNYPYISKTITEFWRRWHISLGTWFKDYVYFPLGGSRVATKRRLIFNLFVVWFLTGVWHGSGFKFIAWGMFYFILLVFEKLVGLPKKVDKYPVLRFFYRLCTLVFINVGWVIFAESSLGGAITHLLAMVGIGSSGLVDANAVFYLREYAGLLLLGVVLSTPMMKVLLQKYQDMLSRKGYDQLKDLSQLAYLVVFFVAVSYLAISAHNPFIYFNF